MTKTHYGLIAGLAGAAFAAWRYFGRRGGSEQMAGNASRGEVVFRNEPAAYP